MRNIRGRKSPSERELKLTFGLAEFTCLWDAHGGTNPDIKPFLLLCMSPPHWNARPGRK